MRRYWVPPQALANGEVLFQGDIYHHVVDVCRMETGSKFEVLTGDGHASFCEMIRVEKKVAVARILETRIVPPLKTPLLQLCISFSRFATMDTVIEKAVELGVASVQPFFSDYSFIRQADKISSSKLQRWSKIVQGATQQSGRGELMSLLPSTPLSQLLSEPGAPGIFAYEGACEKTLKEGLKSFEAPDSLRVFVGSEGGFSEAEVALFRARGFEPLSLGRQVLRVETACVALLGIIKYEFDL